MFSSHSSQFSHCSLSNPFFSLSFSSPNILSDFLCHRTIQLIKISMGICRNRNCLLISKFPPGSQPFPTQNVDPPTPFCKPFGSILVVVWSPISSTFFFHIFTHSTRFYLLISFNPILLNSRLLVPNFFSTFRHHPFTKPSFNPIPIPSRFLSLHTNFLLT